MEKFLYHFKDCYGFDKLSKVLLIVGLILMLIPIRAFWILGLTVVIYSDWRAFSKNKYKRYQELQSFMNFSGIFGQWKSEIKDRMYNLKNYKVFKCPNCSQKLRVPRKKGKMIITCSKCGREFKARS